MIPADPDICLAVQQVMQLPCPDPLMPAYRQHRDIEKPISSFLLLTAWLAAFLPG